MKTNNGKVRLDLIPSEMIFALGSAITAGAYKYAERDWEKGLKWSLYFGALMRHMWCWWAGKGPTTKSFLFGDTDEETGHSHLWHAAACLAFLITYEERETGEDDRVNQNN